MKGKVAIALLVVVAAAGVLLVDWEPGEFTEVGGNYPPVTGSQLRGTSTVGANGLRWKFEEERFVITGEPISAALCEEILGSDAEVTRIEGRWEIRDGYVDLFVDGAGERKSSVPVFDTGVIRVEAGGEQLVFGKG